jgi:two-component system cell cycle sensor histidine kinase/response regulator CckA
MIMTDVGGEEAYSQLKEINPNIKVLPSSGYSISGQAQEILNRGCDGFIQKLFKLEVVSQVIPRQANLATTQRYPAKITDLEAMR